MKKRKYTKKIYMGFKFNSIKYYICYIDLFQYNFKF